MFGEYFSTFKRAFPLSNGNRPFVCPFRLLMRSYHFRECRSRRSKARICPKFPKINLTYRD